MYRDSTLSIQAGGKPVVREYDRIASSNIVKEGGFGLFVP